MESSSTSINKNVPFFFEWVITILGIGVTVLAFSLFLHETGSSSIVIPEFSGNIFVNIETLVFVGIVGFLVYGNLVYQFTRLGYFSRKAKHQVATRQELESLYVQSPPSVTVLVPSFKEEPRIVFQTLLSAALQEYPNFHLEF